MRKIFAGTLFAGIAATAVALGSSPAAATTFTVTNGGDSTGTTSNLTLTDVDTGARIMCHGTWSVDAPDGTGPGTDLFATTGLALSCTTALNLTASVSGTLGFFNASWPGNGFTTGTLTGTDLVVNIAGACTTRMRGELDNVTYDNSGALTIDTDATPKLTIPTGTGSGCLGLFLAGDWITIQATFTFSPAFQISSP
jgi:hypothetical protein